MTILAITLYLIAGLCHAAGMRLADKEKVSLDIYVFYVWAWLPTTILIGLFIAFPNLENIKL